MKPNLPQHPCAGKCQRFTDEQCKTCLVPELPISNKQDADFLQGDAVVYMSHIELENLDIVEAYQPNDHYWLESGQCVYKTWIRPATKAEIHANRRLSEAEQALAEVS